MRDFTWTADMPAKSRKARKNDPRMLRMDWRSPTGDESYEWAPAFIGPDDEPEVRGMVMQLTTGSYRVAFWGADDFGLEKDFPPTTCFGDVIREALAVPEPVTMEWLLAHGFVGA